MVPGSRKLIAHLDLDCFFVSVERIFNPSLRGKPVAVGGSPEGRSVVASASYEARAFGVHSAMPMARALRLCPDLIVVHGSHGKYGEYSNRLTDLLEGVAPIVERCSIDEMNLDLTGCESLYANDLEGFLRGLKRRIWETFTLPCTIALASNKTLAKIAANTVKPDGLLVVPHGSEQSFLAPLPVEAIPGVGKKTAETLHRFGLRTIAQCQARSGQELIRILGSYGASLHRIAHGGGSEHLTPDRVRKSISKEETFASDVADAAVLETKLYSMVESICYILRRRQERARTVTLKMRYTDFTTVTRQQACQATDLDPAIFTIARDLFRVHHQAGRPIRLIGVGVTNLTEPGDEELQLFDEGEHENAALAAADALRKKFGTEIIHYAGSRRRAAKGH